MIFFDPSAVTTMGAEQIAESKKVGAVGVFSPELDGKQLKFRTEVMMIRIISSGATRSRK